jgi:tetratricopeptide (TPR) repeat protein
LSKKQKPAFLTLLAIVVSLALMPALQGCGVVNGLRAKNSLNDGVREFNKGKYQLAEEKFARALDLDPDLTNAQLFYARALNAQFDQGLTDELGKKTIAAYDDIIKKNQDKPDAVDQSLAFKANIYSQLSRVSSDNGNEYRARERETLEKRATLPSATTKTKADVYYSLGVGYWKESYDLNAGYVSKNRPIPPDILEKMKPLDQKAHEYLQKAISVDPNYSNAWFYEKLVYIEEIKYTPGKKDELTKKAFEMQDKYTAMQKQQQQQAAAEAAAPAK